MYLRFFRALARISLYRLCFSKQSVVTTTANVGASVNLVPTLTNDDAACQNCFTAKAFTPRRLASSRDRYESGRQQHMCHFNLLPNLKR